MALFPVGDNNPIDIYPIAPDLDGTEMIAIENKGTTKLYVPLSSIMSYVSSAVSAKFILASPYTMVDSDNFLLSDLIVPGPLFITMRPASSAYGSVLINDYAGIAGSHNITLIAAGTDRFAGNDTTYVMTFAYQSVEFVPVQVGTSTWKWIMK
jgi:hypothetical protein